METLYFVLGMLSVVAMAAVVSLFKIRKEMSEMVTDRLDESVNHLSSYIERVERRIDEVEMTFDSNENRVVDYADKLHKQQEESLNDLYRYVDSRTDKMASGISQHIADINKEIDSLR